MTGPLTEQELAQCQAELDTGSAYWDRLYEKDVLQGLVTMAHGLVAAQEALRQSKLDAIKGVLDLMRNAGRTFDDPYTEPDTIYPHSNGYSTWFISQEQAGPNSPGTKGLEPEDILRRIEARALLGVSAEPLKDPERDDRDAVVVSDCISCEQERPSGECSASKRACGHHCNHSWTHDHCDWCRTDIDAGSLLAEPPAEAEPGEAT